jgi:hypothetical protein
VPQESATTHRKVLPRFGTLDVDYSCSWARDPRMAERRASLTTLMCLLLVGGEGSGMQSRYTIPLQYRYTSLLLR